MLFNGYDASGHDNLWVTNGTAAGTSELSVAGADSSGLTPRDLTAFGSEVLFNGYDASGHENLWVTNGTAAGTSEVLLVGSGGLDPLGLTAFESNQTPCYCAGTLILTECGEAPVEALAIGDKVITTLRAARPIKWIGRRSYAGRFVMGRKDILPVCIKAGALDDNVPRRDLWISPHHAMYLEGVLIEAKDLVNGVSIVQAERAEKVEYFHVELETHDVIVAEGALSESFIDDDDRFMFHNAHEYRVLYPAAIQTVARYCAQRLDEGYEVEAVRRRIALRAGLVSEGISTLPGKLRGFIDRVTRHVVEGWAQNADHPEAPVCLDILVSGRLIGRALANRHRKDLEQAGLGSGCHAFEFTPPYGLAFAPDAAEVRRSLDQAALPFSSQARRTGTSAAA